MTDPSQSASSSTSEELRPRPNRKRLVARVIGALLVVALLGWVGKGLVEDADQLDWTHAFEQPDWLAGAALAWLVTFVFRGWLWGEFLRRSGYPVPAIAPIRVFYASQLGRFLPGKVWSLLGAGAFGPRIGVPASASMLYMFVFLVLHYMVGCVLALFVVEAFSQFAWTAGAVAVFGVGLLGFLFTPAFPKLLARLGRLTGRPLDEIPLPSPAVLLMTVVGLAIAWMGAAFGFWCFVRAMVPAETAVLAPVGALGAFSASLVAGFLAIFAPMGLGVREAVMVGAIGGELGVGYAAMVAIGSRVLLLAVELTLSAWGIWPHLFRKSFPSSREAPVKDDAHQ